MSAQLVIFDCDGVLVDSERIGNHVMAQYVSELGWPMGVDEALHRFKGYATDQIWSEITNHLGHPLPDNVEQAFRQRQLAAVRDVQIIDGVMPLLSALPIPYCVASNGPHTKMHVTLGAVGLLERFGGKIFSRFDVGRAKPAPDLLLHAAQMMGAQPRTCIVIDDSPIGVEAACAADMIPVGFAGTQTADATALARAGAAHVITHMSEAASLVDLVN